MPLQACPSDDRANLSITKRIAGETPCVASIDGLGDSNAGHFVLKSCPQRGLEPVFAAIRLDPMSPIELWFYLCGFPSTSMFSVNYNASLIGSIETHTATTKR
jgi:hypothetical protein